MTGFYSLTPRRFSRRLSGKLSISTNRTRFERLFDACCRSSSPRTGSVTIRTLDAMRRLGVKAGGATREEADRHEGV